MTDIVHSARLPPPGAKRLWKDIGRGLVAPTVHVYRAPMDPVNAVYKLLRNGESPDMNVDGSTPVAFQWQVPANRILYLARFNFVMLDNAVAPAKFGGVPILANGCLFQIVDSDGIMELLDFTGGQPLKATAHFVKLAGVDVATTAGPGGINTVPIRFTVAKAGALLRMTAGQYVRFTIRDDLSGLNYFQCMLQGQYV